MNNTKILRETILPVYFQLKNVNQISQNSDAPFAIAIEIANEPVNIESYDEVPPMF